jgi:hypothetical protein
MDPRNLEKQREPEVPRFLTFPHLPDDAKHEDGTPALNKYSSTLTAGHNFPGAQVHYLKDLSQTLADAEPPHRQCCTLLVCHHVKQ